MLKIFKINFPARAELNYGAGIYLERTNPFISFKLRQSHNGSKNFWCDYFNHKWVYMDFTGRINSKGDKYHFTEKRFCQRCEARQYLYDKWEDQLWEIDFDVPMP